MQMGAGKQNLRQDLQQERHTSQAPLKDQERIPQEPKNLPPLTRDAESGKIFDGAGVDISWLYDEAPRLAEVMDEIEDGVRAQVP